MRCQRQSTHCFYESGLRFVFSYPMPNSFIPSFLYQKGQELKTHQTMMQNLNQISKRCLDVEVLGDCFALHFLDLKTETQMDFERKYKSYIFTSKRCGDTTGDVLIG